MIVLGSVLATFPGSGCSCVLYLLGSHSSWAWLIPDPPASHILFR